MDIPLDVSQDYFICPPGSAQREAVRRAQVTRFIFLLNRVTKAGERAKTFPALPAGPAAGISRLPETCILPDVEPQRRPRIGR